MDLYAWGFLWSPLDKIDTFCVNWSENRDSGWRCWGLIKCRFVWLWVWMMRKSWVQHFLFSIFVSLIQTSKYNWWGRESRWVTVLEQSFVARINIWWFLCPWCHLSEIPSSMEPLTCEELRSTNYFGSARIGKGSSAENLQDAKPGVIAHFPAGFTKCWCSISSFRELRRCHHLLCFLWTCSRCFPSRGLIWAVYPTHPSKWLCILLIWQCKNRQGGCFLLVIILIILAKLFTVHHGLWHWVVMFSLPNCALDFPASKQPMNVLNNFCPIWRLNLMLIYIKTTRHHENSLCSLFWSWWSHNLG